jgi:hypothetical protein
MNIKGLNRADVLAALYNASHPQGMGMLHFDPTPMTTEEAQALIDEQSKRPRGAFEAYFDYLKGRVMKIGFKGDEIDPRLYDRDLGDGAAERAIASLRK